MKKCPKCQIIKPKQDFYKDLGRKDGLQYSCKECKKYSRKDYYWRNPEFFKEKYKEYYKKTREYHRNRLSRFRQENPLYEPLYRSLNRDKISAKDARRRAAKLKQCPAWLSSGMKLEILGLYSKAQLLSTLTGVKHHVDHIIPLQGVSVRGLHVPWNLQIITKTENLKKGNRIQEA